MATTQAGTSDSPVLRGGCICGSARYEVKGTPHFTIFCHCTICQRMSGSAFIHSVHYRGSQFTFISPQNKSSSVESQATSHLDSLAWGNTTPCTRYRCKKCGIAIADIRLEQDDACIWSTQLDRDGAGGKVIGWNVVAPTCHIYYDTAIVEVNDDLPKWEGLPDISKRLG
ncbi:Mss4-like protein [Flagelloscypha sp. PMI_526]|nr:Mss4-like protein [Flagelloscypha sp. PMI_526]